MCYPTWNDAAMDLHRAAIMISVLHVSLRQVGWFVGEAREKSKNSI